MYFDAAVGTNRRLKGGQSRSALPESAVRRKRRRTGGSGMSRMAKSTRMTHAGHRAFRLMVFFRTKRIDDGSSRRFVISGDFKFAVDSLLSSLDCDVFLARFRGANLDPAADEKPVFPNARRNHFECIVYTLVSHAARSPFAPECPRHKAIPIRLAKLQQFTKAQR
jgi:hypothetical protein